MSFRFWESVQELKALPQKDVMQRVNVIWAEYLAPDASCPVNVDSHSLEITKKNMLQPDRWTFDTAAVSLTPFSLTATGNVWVRFEQVSCNMFPPPTLPLHSANCLWVFTSH